MIDINLLRNKLDFVVENLKRKNFIFNNDAFNKLESARRDLQIKMESLQNKRNSISKEIGVLKSKGEDSGNLLKEVITINDSLKITEVQFNDVHKEMQAFLDHIPNLLNDEVPNGLNETYNLEIRKVGIPKNFEFTVKDHVDLGLSLNKGLDFELGAKISGSRFVVMQGQLAKLHRALAQFMLDVHINEHGYKEIYIPYIVSAKSVYNTGQLPKFEDDLFRTAKSTDHSDPMYLISTAEIPLTNLVSQNVIDIEQLPLKFVAYSPCFRSEAGSYGKDTRGMIRMHQFDKVEMVQIVHHQKSRESLDILVNHAENILQKLELPYRVMLLCGGDTGFCSSMTYDLEVWIPSQNCYREISSCSNMTDFQARRMMARVRSKDSKLDLLHTLNGSGLAVGRTLVAILENYQNANGTITVPRALYDYMQCKIIE